MLCRRIGFVGWLLLPLLPGIGVGAVAEVGVGLRALTDTPLVPASQVATVCPFSRAFTTRYG